eukprot:15455661-Alexandrium_andersonii.AAC.1
MHYRIRKPSLLACRCSMIRSSPDLPDLREFALAGACLRTSRNNVAQRFLVLEGAGEDSLQLKGGGLRASKLR